MTSQRDQRRLRALARYCVPFLLIGLWQLIYMLAGDRAMASPGETATAVLDNIGNWATHVWATVSALLIAFLIVAFFGIAIGFGIGMSDFWSRTLNPLLLIAYSIPKVTLYPIFLLVFGLTLQGRIAFAVLHGILPIIIICVEAARTLPEVYGKIARVYQLSLRQRITQVYVPALRPQLVVALRLGFSLCFLGLLLAEMFASYHGLGSRLLHYTTLQQPEMIIGVILVVVLLALLGTFMFLLWQEKSEARIGADSVRL